MKSDSQKIESQTKPSDDATRDVDTQANSQGNTVNNNEGEKKKCSWRYWIIRLTILLVLITIIVLVIVYNGWVSDTIEKFLEWLRDNPVLGTICLSLIYIVATLFFLPGSLLTLGAGVALQAALENTALAILVGTIGIFVGAWIGSNLAMILGRYLFRDSTKKLAQKYRLINAIDKALEKEGLKFTFLLRLCPLIPFNAFNYIMGITSVTFKAYAIGGFGMIPGTIVYIFVGTTIGNISAAASGDFEGGAATLVFLIVGTILAFVAIVYISIVVKRYLNKQLAEDKANDEESQKTDGKSTPPQHGYELAAIAATENQPGSARPN